MHFSSYMGLVALAWSSCASASVLKGRDFTTHDYFTLHLKAGASPSAAAEALGLEYLGPLGAIPDHYHYSAKRGTHNANTLLEAVKSRRRKRDTQLGRGLDDILWSRQSKLKPRMQKRSLEPGLSIRADPLEDVDHPDVVAIRKAVMEKLQINDPIFHDQWHLLNSVQVGHDVNVTGLWMEGITGVNATVAVVDDGLDMYSDDLKDNYFAAGSYDFNDHTDEPKPRLSDDRHGTRCAGEIAAVRNNVCGVGVAYDSKIAGLRILSKSISDEDEAVAITYNSQKNQIYSCSWGPPDDGRSMEAPSTLIKKAMQSGIQQGRDGLGSIYVFAAGNGAASGDNCNFDGYTNSIYSITVGAIDRKGLHPYYSEKCSAGLVVTYSSGSGDAIHTTDVGTDSCYTRHGGTSAAAPLGAGIFALVLGVRPDLNWRDLQYLCVETAVPLNLEDEDGWQDTFIGRKYSHTFAYGKLDAYALVEAAKVWKSVKPQAWYKSPWQHVKHAIPQGDQGLSSIFEVTQDMLDQANVERLEHVQVTMNIEHTRRGDLSVDLVSPHGIVSHLSAVRPRDDLPAGYVDWTFMSVVHWGEPGVGKWTVIVKDTNNDDHSGNFTDWRLTLWGEARDGAKQELYPLPTDHDDDDHDVMTAIVSTTSIEPAATPTTLATIPTDHPDRPVNEKPSEIPVSTSTEGVTETNHPSATVPPTSSSTASSEADATPTPDKFLLPSIFPTFGVSPRTQVWIYGAGALILVFCGALGAYIVVQKRRRARIDRADYDFELIGGGAAGEGESLTGQKRTRRGGELYDAFAGESDEEMFSEDDGDGGYRDGGSNGAEKSRLRGEESEEDEEVNEKRR